MAKIKWSVCRWTNNETKEVTAFSVNTCTDFKGLVISKEPIVFRVASPHDIALQGKRAEDYAAYLNLLEERSEEVTITGAVAQRLLKEENK